MKHLEGRIVKRATHWVTLTFDLAFHWAFRWAKP